MPDAEGRLTPEDKAKVSAHFARHWKGEVPCPVCKNATSWSTAEHVVQSYRWANNQFAAPTYPFIPVICTNCGHTMFFNAVVIGVVPLASPPPPLPQGPSEPDVQNAFAPPLPPEGG